MKKITMAVLVSLVIVLKINNADLLGFSNGGNTIMRVATRHPEPVNKLVIISAFYKREGMMKGFFEGMVDANLGNMPGPRPLYKYRCVRTRTME